jgi:hypothetical protein
MPGRLDVDSRSDNADEDHATDFIFGNRFNRYAKAAHVLVGDGAN